MFEVATARNLAGSGSCTAGRRLVAALLLGPLTGWATDSAAPRSVADTPTRAMTASGEYIAWIEHVIDDEQVNGGVPVRGGDGIAVADLDRDGFVDIITAQEDSNHVRVAYGSADPQSWTLRTLAEGALAGAVEDVAIADLNGDGWPDLIAACEEAHLLYLQNPGRNIRDSRWAHTIPDISRGRGSWLRVFAADVTGNGRPDLTAANKGAPDIVRPGIDVPENGATSLITLHGPPLDAGSWREQVLFREGIPNTALPFDVDGDGDPDVLAAMRVRQQLALIENLGPDGADGIRHRALPVTIQPAFSAPADWKGLANAFQADVADLNGDQRVDLILNVTELSREYPERRAGLGWLEQPETLDGPWRYHRIGNTLPDWVIGIHLADIDGDGDLDVVTGGYSGINILAGSYSAASRDFDDPAVTASSSVGRIAWFENPGNPSSRWQRHDIARRVRGMYDMFVSRDMDGDGDLDIVAPRGNSGAFDGVFWLEQVRSREPRPALTPARTEESRHLPLPPADWLEHYDRTERYIAPNKAGH